MNLFKKILAYFKSKEWPTFVKKSNKGSKVKKIINSSEWRDYSIRYYTNKHSKQTKAFVELWRDATEKEMTEALAFKMDCEIEISEPKTLDSIWTQALKEMQKHGELQDYVARTSFKTKEQLLKEEKEVDEEISKLFVNYKNPN
jgi:hypothetical protein